MVQLRGSTGVDSGGFRTFSTWGTGILCLLQMYYLALELYRHWNAMGPSSRALLLVYVAFYPIPWLLLIKKDANPFVAAILVYVAMGVAALLIFPTVP